MALFEVEEPMRVTETSVWMSDVTADIRTGHLPHGSEPSFVEYGASCGDVFVANCVAVVVVTSLTLFPSRFYTFQISNLNVDKQDLRFSRR
jgi:hypothetical protein